jgi:hypothetical protein
LFGSLASRLFRDPAVRLEAPRCVDLALRRARDGRLSLHLLNVAGAQRAERFLGVDFVPAVGPIAVELRLPRKPAGVRWLPDGGPVSWSWKGGTLSATVPRLHVHGVLVVEPR